MHFLHASVLLTIDMEYCHRIIATEIEIPCDPN